MKQYDKILGCLVGAAAGDAMGAPTETRTRAQIKEYFSKEVTDFLVPPMDTFGRGNQAGQITDDFSLAYITARTVVDNGGKINSKIAKQAVIDWSKHEEWFERFVGPTTRAAVESWQTGKQSESTIFIPANDNLKSSDGAAMKIAPVSLLSNGNIDKAIKNAIILCAPTHPNNIALSGAGAIAAAVAEAMKEDANLYTVVQAGIYGARQAEILGRKYHVNAGASIEKRIKLAVSIGLTADSLDEAMDELADVIGSGLPANEAVPTVFGLMVATKGDTVKAIQAGVNIGSDTDTVATMIGGILGTLNGIDSMPKKWTTYLEKQNNIDLQKLAKEIEALNQ